MIKLRAWDKDENRYFIDGKEGHLANLLCCDDWDMLDPDDYVWEQFTGLKDVSGKDIYVGDIIQYFGANRRVKAKKEFGVVVFKADKYGSEFTSVIQNAEHGFGGISPLNDLVVGNVHENPELLEESYDN